MMMRGDKTFARCTKGAAAVEFGIIALPLVMLMFGSLEFGRAMWTREALQETAIAAARCMGLVQSSCGTAGVYSASMAQGFVQSQAAAWGISLGASNMTLNSAATCAGVSGFSQVTLSYTFMTVVPLMIPSLAAGTQLSAVACFPNNAA